MTSGNRITTAPNLGRQLRTRVKTAIVACTAMAAFGSALVLSPTLTSPANAEDQSWPYASSVCVGSGAGTGLTMTIGVTEDNPLNAAHLGEEVYWRAWVHTYDPGTGAMEMVQVSDWSHYTLKENGVASSGSISWSADGTPTVMNGGTTAPGVYTVPVTLFVGQGLWAKPYVEAWTASGGYTTRAVPIDANSVETDQSYGCYYR